MPRTNPVAVAELMAPGGDYDGTSSLTLFIRIAAALVNRVAACAADKGLALSTEELELMEGLVACHAYQSSDQALAAENTAKAGGTYQGKTGMYLEGTKYGQMALAMDSSGCLRAITMGKRADITWLGKNAIDSIPVDQR